MKHLWELTYEEACDIADVPYERGYVTVSEVIDCMLSKVYEETGYQPYRGPWVNEGDPLINFGWAPVNDSNVIDFGLNKMVDAPELDVDGGEVRDL